MSDGLSSIVKNVSLVMALPILVFGFYVIAHGHLTPGGGFPGGAVIATFFALLFVAFGKKAGKIFFDGELHLAEATGLCVFALVAFFGLEGTFFRNFLSNSNALFGMGVPFGPNGGSFFTGGVIPVMNMAIGLEVFAALTLIVAAMYFSGDGKE